MGLTPVLNAGLLITYTIMLGDVLVGKAPEYNGVIPNLTGIHTGDLWYLDRRFVASFCLVSLVLYKAIHRFLRVLLASSSHIEKCSFMQVAMVVVILLLPLTLQRWVNFTFLLHAEAYCLCSELHKSSRDSCMINFVEFSSREYFMPSC